MEKAIQQMLSVSNNDWMSLGNAAAFTIGHDDKKAAAFLDRALAAPKYDENLSYGPFVQAYLLLKDGKQQEAETLIKRRLNYHKDQFKENPKSLGDAFFLGSFFSLLGDTDNAIFWIEKCIKLGGTDYWWFERYPDSFAGRNDPRYKALMAEARQKNTKLRAEVLAMEAKEEKKAFLD
jgi:tetratricopeptide (TPR) repeat protein